MTSQSPHIKTIPLSIFRWDKAANTLDCDASDIGPLREGQWWLQMISVSEGGRTTAPTDARKIGIAIHNPKTKRTEYFILSKEIWTGHGEDREFGGWQFSALNEALGTSVTIFND